MLSNKKYQRFCYIGVILLSLMFTMATTSVAKQPDRIANIIMSPEGIEFNLLQPVLSINIKIAGPGGLYFQKQLDPYDPYLPLYTLGDDLQDGYYKYEIKALSTQEVIISKEHSKPQLNNGRDQSSLNAHAQMSQTNHIKLAQSGGFQIKNNDDIEKNVMSAQKQNKRGDADE
ncbi:MAG: hypothetical protein K8R67_12450 [Desulfobacteraceae bacterium]|nr:hypothetical protein [Desulfobacteraceae bacterium]